MKQYTSMGPYSSTPAWDHTAVHQHGTIQQHTSMRPYSSTQAWDQQQYSRPAHHTAPALHNCPRPPAPMCMAARPTRHPFLHHPSARPPPLPHLCARPPTPHLCTRLPSLTYVHDPPTPTQPHLCTRLQTHPALTPMCMNPPLPPHPTYVHDAKPALPDLVADFQSVQGTFLLLQLRNQLSH